MAQEKVEKGKEKKEKESYGEAMEKIRAILASLQDENTDIDTLAERVKEASQLIAFCRAKLHKAEGDVGKILGAEE